MYIYSRSHKAIDRRRSKQAMKALSWVARVLMLSIFATILFISPIFMVPYAALLVFGVIATWKGRHVGSIGILGICTAWLVILTVNYTGSSSIRTYYLHDGVMIIGFTACITSFCGAALNIAIRSERFRNKSLAT
jgi:membrane protein insertase Oxa1/YidC/SpoIIIJ